MSLTNFNKEKTYELLGMQPYRLSYWKMASDEINYRRFFEINDLMSIRMERDDVFEEAHRLIIQLISEGKITGKMIFVLTFNCNRYSFGSS